MQTEYNYTPNPAPQQPVADNSKAKLAGIFNIVGAVLCVAVVVVLLSGLLGGQLTIDQGDTGENLGAGIALVLLLPFSIFVVVPVSIVNAIVHTVLGIKMFSALKGKVVSKGSYVCSIIFKCIGVIMYVLGAMLLLDFATLITTPIPYIVTAMMVLCVICFVVVIVLENMHKKQAVQQSQPF